VSARQFSYDSLFYNPPYLPAIIEVKFAPLNFRVLGLTTRLSNGTYFIQLNKTYPLKTIQRTFFHELVHVYQFQRGLLREDGVFVYWKGQAYDWNSPWHMRPWEIHAEAMTDSLYKDMIPLSK
jgi:hypothetical protein